MSADETNLTEWGVVLCKVMRLVPIPGADQIEVAFVGDGNFVYDYPVVVRKGYESGDKVVYVPVDSVLPDEPEFAFLGSDRRRLRAKKLRGVYSEGLLVSVRDASAVAARRATLNASGEEAAALASRSAEAVVDAAEIALREVPVGFDISTALGIERWRAPVRGERQTPGTSGGHGPDETVFPAYRVCNAKKGEGLQFLSPDTQVVLTEKIHGANIRFGLVETTVSTFSHNDVTPDGEIIDVREDEQQYVYHLGSHNSMRKIDHSSGDWWNAVSSANYLEKRLRENALVDLAIYGEVFGKGVQDLTYGRDLLGGFGLRIFAAYNLKSQRWLGWFEVEQVAITLGLSASPVLWRGRLEEAPYRELAEGKTTMFGGHVREGVVIHCDKEGGPRKTWKFVGQGYRMRKGDQTDNGGD